MTYKDKPKHNSEKYHEFRENLEKLSIEYFEYLSKSDVIVGLIYEAVDCALSDDRSDKSIIALMEILSDSMSDWIVNDNGIKYEKEELKNDK